MSRKFCRRDFQKDSEKHTLTNGVYVKYSRNYSNIKGKSRYKVLGWKGTGMEKFAGFFLKLTFPKIGKFLVFTVIVRFRIIY